MNKFLFNTLALSLMAVISISNIAHAEPANTKSEQRVVANGSEIKNTAYTNADGTEMLPVRDVSEKFGYTVKWNDEEKSCLVGSDDIPSVKFYIGKDMCIYGADAEGKLAAKAELKDGVSYVSSDFFTDYFYLNVAETDGGVNVSELNPVIIKEGETTKLKAGEVFAVALEENPSTGYAWNIEKDNAVKILKKNTVPTSTDAEITGAPNNVTWYFRCDEAGEYTLKYTYERSFEANSAVKTVEYKVVIE